MEKNNQKGLFIAGNIRSGTTILWKALNTSPQVCLLYEPLLYENSRVPEFSFWFRKRMKNYNMCVHKGTYPPAPRLEGEDTALNSLKRLTEIYDYVGEKLVFQTSAKHQMDNFLPFHKKYFPDSQYFFIIRHPIETIWSIFRRWPDIDISFAFKFWLWSLDFMLRGLDQFPNSNLIIFERLTMQTPQTMAKILNISLQMPSDMIQRKERNTNLDTMALPQPIQEYAASGEICKGMYSTLVDSLSEKTLDFKQNEKRSMVISDLRQTLQQSLDELDAL